jgi:hypothetical protein
MKKVEFSITDFAIDNTITLGEVYNERLDASLFDFCYTKPKPLDWLCFQNYLKKKHGLDLPSEDKTAYNKYINSIKDD